MNRSNDIQPPPPSEVGDVPERERERARSREHGVLAGYLLPLWRLSPTWLRWMTLPAAVAIVLAIGASDTSGIRAAIYDLNEFPTTYASADIGTAIGESITERVDWVTETFSAAFIFFDETVEAGIERINTALLSIPWPALVLLLVIISLRVVGRGMAIFVALALGSILALGLWDNTLLTATLILISLVTALIVAIPLGIAAAEYRPIEPPVRWLMDTMQTLPSMVYLVPALAVFGLGNVAGVIATVVFVIPPAFKFVYLGISGVSGASTEASESFGASKLQILLEVKLPLALPNIMGGVSQATMASLSIVIVASLVGAKGLGDVVERSLNWLDSGNAIIAGFAIVVVAVIIDRITEALAQRQYRKYGFEDTGGFNF